MYPDPYASRAKKSHSSNLLSGSSHVDSRGRCVRSFCYGKVYPDSSSIQLHSIGTFLSLGTEKIQLAGGMNFTTYTNS